MDSVFKQERVNITVVTTCKGPSKQKAVGWYLIEHVKDGIPKTKDGCLYRDSITGKALTLQLMANALYILSKSNAQFDTIEVYIEDQYIESAYLNGWMDKWKDSDWKNSKGQPVADCEIWQQLYDQMEKLAKRFIVIDRKSSYSNIMHMWSEDRLKTEIRLKKYKEDKENA